MAGGLGAGVLVQQPWTLGPLCGQLLAEGGLMHRGLCCGVLAAAAAAVAACVWFGNGSGL